MRELVSVVLLPSLNTARVVYISVAILAVLMGFAMGFWVGRRRTAGKAPATVETPLAKPAETILSVQEESAQITKGFDDLREFIQESDTALEKTFDRRFSEILSRVTAISSKLTELPANLTQHVKEILRQEALRREEDEIKRQLEADNKRQEEMRVAKAEFRNSLNTRLTSLDDRSNILKISLLTKDLISGLAEVSPKAPRLTQSFKHYLSVAQQVDQIRMQLSNLDVDSRNNLVEAQTEIAADLGSLEREVETLNASLRPAWFVTLLEDTTRNPSLEDRAAELKTLLGLEEVVVVPGREIRGLQDLDVVSTEGMGSRTIIGEVLEKGYRERETGLLVSKPKVKLRLES